jgi:hypothetical protein
VLATTFVPCRSQSCTAGPCEPRLSPATQLFVDGFEVSPFEREFGRHVAVFYPLEEFPGLKQRLIQRGAELSEPLRPTPFERFFFKEPVNGYVFEVIDQARASHFDQ